MLDLIDAHNQQGRSQKFILGGCIFYCTTLQSYILYSSLTTSAAISAQKILRD